MADKVVQKVISPEPIFAALPPGVVDVITSGNQINELKVVLDGLLENASQLLWTIIYTDGSEELVSLATPGKPVEARQAIALTIKNLLLWTWSAEVADGSDANLVTTEMDSYIEMFAGFDMRPEDEANQSIEVQTLAFLVGPEGATRALWSYDGDARFLAALDPEKATMLPMANDIGIGLALVWQ